MQEEEEENFTFLQLVVIRILLLNLNLTTYLYLRVHRTVRIPLIVACNIKYLLLMLMSQVLFVSGVEHS